MALAFVLIAACALFTGVSGVLGMQGAGPLHLRPGGQALLLARAQGGGNVHDHIALRGPPQPLQLRQQAGRQRPAARAKFPDFARARFIKCLRHLRRQRAAKQGRKLRRGHEIAPIARPQPERACAPRVITQARRVKRQTHEFIKRQPAASGGDAPGNQLLQGIVFSHWERSFQNISSSNIKSWANFLKNEIMNKEDIHTGQEGAENQHEKPAGCLWPLLWLILCLPIVPIVVYALFLLLISYYVKVPVWFLALFQVLPILAGSTGWVVFFMHVAKGRAKNADPVWLGLLAGSLIIYALGFAILSMRHSLR